MWRALELYSGSPDLISQGRTGQKAWQPASWGTVFGNLSAQALPAPFEAQELLWACRFTAVSYLREQATGTRCKWSKRNLKPSSPSWFLERLKDKRTKVWTQTRVVMLLWEASKGRGATSGFRSPLSLLDFLLCELLSYKTSTRTNFRASSDKELWVLSERRAQRKQ